MKSDGVEVIQFRLAVASENQQRMIVGTKGKNI